MRKSLQIIAIIVASLSVACAPKSDNKASADYVKASQKISEAKEVFSKAQYVKALELVRDSQKDINAIISKYPESSIALRLVSDASIMAGPCLYRDLEELTPKLERFANPTMAKLSIAWAMAYDYEDLISFMKLLIRYRAELGISPEEFKQMKSVCLSTLEGYSERVSFIAKLETFNASKPVARKNEMSAVASSKTDVKPVPSKIKSMEDFLMAAKSDAVLVPYQIRAVDNLKEKALMIANSSDESRARFTEILSTAHNNIMKISTLNLREKSLSTLAIAYLEVGEVPTSIKIARSLTDQNLFDMVFNSIADKATQSDNYISALGLAERIKNPVAKDKFLVRLVEGLAKRAMYKEALEISKRVSSVGARNNALATATSYAMKSGDSTAVSSFVSLLNIKDLDFLKVFYPKIPAYSGSEQGDKVYRMALLSSELIAHNKKLAKVINDLALSMRKNPSEQYSSSASVIVANMMNLGETNQALDFITQNISYLQRDEFIPYLCSAAVAQAKSDMPTAEKYFSIVADLNGNVMELAFAMARAGIPLEKQVEILKNYMPQVF